MHRFFLSDLTAPALTGSEAHHARQVLRLRDGDEVTVFDGAGNFARCQIAGITRESVALRPVERGQTPPLPCRITLACAIIKKNMDFIVQKATELGAAAIVPLITERTIVRPEKSDRWREIALEACKQCGNNWLPEIAAPLPVKEFLGKTGNFDLKVVAALEPGAKPLRQAIVGVGASQNLWERFPTATGEGTATKSRLKTAPTGTETTGTETTGTETTDTANQDRLAGIQSVCVLIGPEGDFTPAEYAAARAAGYWPVTLGPLVLRADTAALYALSIVHHELVTHRGVC